MAFSGKIILVIDDSYIDRLVTTMLIKHTYGVVDMQEANGGFQALEILDSEQVKSAKEILILLDIKMPRMSGFEFLDKFDLLPEGLKCRTTIVMLSSTLDPDDIRQAMRHPSVKKLISKPLSINELKGFI